MELKWRPPFAINNDFHHASYLLNISTRYRRKVPQSDVFILKKSRLLRDLFRSASADAFLCLPKLPGCRGGDVFYRNSANWPGPPRLPEGTLLTSLKPSLVAFNRIKLRAGVAHLSIYLHWHVSKLFNLCIYYSICLTYLWIFVKANPDFGKVKSNKGSFIIGNLILFLLLLHYVLATACLIKEVYKIAFPGTSWRNGRERFFLNCVLVLCGSG